MEEWIKRDGEKRSLQDDILYSKAIKAGKRIYYLDVKKNKSNDLFLSITESKKMVSGTPESPVVQFEKHKIFLYKEDFDKFSEGLEDILQYIKVAREQDAALSKTSLDAAHGEQCREIELSLEELK